MTDDELKECWPELGVVVAELRLIGQVEVADRLVDTFLSGSTSSEIVGHIALILRDHHALRVQLSDAAQNAWDTIMADVSRAFRGSKFALWLARLSR